MVTTSKDNVYHKHRVQPAGNTYFNAADRLVAVSRATPSTGEFEHPLRSQADPMAGEYMVFEMLQALENESPGLTHWMKAVELTLRIKPLEMRSLNMITHLGNAAIDSPAEWALSLTTDKGEHRRRRLDVGRLLLDKRVCGKGDRKSVPPRHLAEATQTQHEVGSLDPKLDSILRL
jgi:hypothetical protein